MANGNPVVARIQAAIDRLRVDPDHVVELRALEVPVRYGHNIVVGGWFDDSAALAHEAAQLNERGAQVYVTLNKVNPALLARAYNRVVERPKATTADHDIQSRVWLPFDIDPVRPAGVAASDAEVAAAKTRALDLANWARGEFKDEPAIWGFSGNGWHLLFRVDLPNDDKTTEAIKHIITLAGDKFTDTVVKIDSTVFNAARIWRLYGTTNHKGDSVPKLTRVHRVARILGEGFSE